MRKVLVLMALLAIFMGCATGTENTASVGDANFTGKISVDNGKYTFKFLYKEINVTGTMQNDFALTGKYKINLDIADKNLAGTVDFDFIKENIVLKSGDTEIKGSITHNSDNEQFDFMIGSSKFSGKISNSFTDRKYELLNEEGAITGTSIGNLRGSNLDIQWTSKKLTGLKIVRPSETEYLLNADEFTEVEIVQFIITELQPIFSNLRKTPKNPHAD